MISRLWVTPGEYSMKARSQNRQGSSSLGDDSSRCFISKVFSFAAFTPSVVVLFLKKQEA